MTISDMKLKKTLASAFTVVIMLPGGLLMGLLGGLFPAWRAARMPVVTALR